MNNIRIGRRLQIAFGAMLLVTVFIAGVGIWRMETLSAISQRQASVDTRRSLLAQQWRGEIRLSVALTMSALMSHDPAFTQATLGEVEDIRASVQGIRQQLLQLLENDSEGLALVAAAEQHQGDYTRIRSRLQERAHAGVEIGGLVQRELPPVASHYLAAVERVLQHAQDILLHEAELARHEARAGEWTMGAALAASLALVLCGAYFVTRSITQPLARAMQGCAAISHGDLTTVLQIRGRDETTQLMSMLARMQQNLTDIVSTVRQNAESVASASTQIAQGNNDLSARTERQAGALQETAASMEELGATVQQNTGSAQRADQLAQQASQVAVRGGAEVGQAVETMQHISESSRRIADIIGVIDGIAFQTNILALNAAVEAARAGEQGRGFAVVAGEVRSLAQRSAEAAKEIKTLIELSVQRVAQGSALVNQAGGTMSEVVDAIRDVARLMAEISAASREQSAGVAQIGAAVVQMDQATQQNAALVEQSAAAAGQLQSQAAQLVQAVAVFQLPGDAAAVRAPQHDAARRPHPVQPTAAALRIASAG